MIKVLENSMFEYKGYLVVNPELLDDSDFTKLFDYKTVYIYDEVQFNTSRDEAYVTSHADDLYRMMSGTKPTIEERLDALEMAIAEIGGLL